MNAVDDFLVYRSAQHHLHDIHGVLVCYAHTVDKMGLYIQPFQQLANLRSTAMDYHGVHTHQFHQHDVPRKALVKLGVRHGITAKLDDEGLAREALNIGQRLGKYFGERASLTLIKRHGTASYRIKEGRA